MPTTSSSGLTSTGVLSADPRLVPDAFPLERLSYREAAELAYFGAKVLHPRTMQPLQEQDIPLYIKNTLNPEAAGTLISSETTAAARYVKAVTTVRAVTVVMIEGAGMVGVPGISARALSAMAARQISVLMISQASERAESLRRCPRRRRLGLAGGACGRRSSSRSRGGDVSRVTARPMCAVVSVVGDQMRQQPGIAGRMFSTLGHAHVNVLAIAQGAAETNISAVVDDADVRLAVSVLHQTFALEHRPVHLAIIGTGVVGRALLEILERQAPHLRQQGGPRSPADRRGELAEARVGRARAALWRSARAARSLQRSHGARRFHTALAPQPRRTSARHRRDRLRGGGASVRDAAGRRHRDRHGRTSGPGRWSSRPTRR